MGWTVTDLSTRPGQVLGRGNPVSYLFAAPGSQRCVVLGSQRPRRRSTMR